MVTLDLNFWLNTLEQATEKNNLFDVAKSKTTSDYIRVKSMSTF